MYMYHNQLNGQDRHPDRTKRKLSQQNPKIITLPNILTTSRIMITPAIGYLIWNGMNAQALCCFAFAAITDLVDGFLARRLNQCSQLGAILDPIADKFLMTTSFVALYKVGLMPAWLVGGFIGRDLALLIGGALLRCLNIRKKLSTIKEYFDFNNHPMPEFKPTLVSKCNTGLQCSLIFLHLGASEAAGVQFDDATLLSLHIVTACTTAISFGQYLSRPFFTALSVRDRI